MEKTLQKEQGSKALRKKKLDWIDKEQEGQIGREGECDERCDEKRGV